VGDTLSRLHLGREREQLRGNIEHFNGFMVGAPPVPGNSSLPGFGG